MNDPIVKFFINPADIIVGSSVILNWDIDVDLNYTWIVSILNVEDNLSLRGKLQYKIVENREFVLQLTNTTLNKVYSYTLNNYVINDDDPPVIYFSASDTYIKTGENVTLYYDIQSKNVVSLYINGVELYTRKWFQLVYPQSNASYTLKVISRGFTYEKTIDVVVQDVSNNKILLFFSDKVQYYYGENIQLQWKIVSTHFLKIRIPEIDYEDISYESTINVLHKGYSKYTLELHTSIGIFKQVLNIGNLSLNIEKFRLNPSVIYDDEPSNLEWKVNGYSYQNYINHGIGMVTNENTQIIPKENTNLTYELESINLLPEKVKSSTSINYRSLPKIHTFITDNNEISNGTRIKLNFSLDGYPNIITLNNSPIEIDKINYELYFTPTVSTDYRLYIENRYGNDEKIIHIGVYDKPVIEYFEIVGDSLNIGRLKKTNVRWNVLNNPKIVQINPLQATVDTTSEKLFEFYENITLELLAKNVAGEDRKAINVKVIQNADILRFSTDKVHILPGETFNFLFDIDIKNTVLFNAEIVNLTQLSIEDLRKKILICPYEVLDSTEFIIRFQNASGVIEKTTIIEVIQEPVMESYVEPTHDSLEVRIGWSGEHLSEINVYINNQERLTYTENLYSFEYVLKSPMNTIRIEGKNRRGSITTKWKAYIEDSKVKVEQL